MSRMALETSRPAKNSRTRRRSARGSCFNDFAPETVLKIVIRRRLDAKRHVVKNAPRLLARELRRSRGMRHQHDHLRHTVASLPRAKEFVRQLRQRDDLEPEQVPIEMERGIHVANPQHDLCETGDSSTHAATA